MNVIHNQKKAPKPRKPSAEQLITPIFNDFNYTGLLFQISSELYSFKSWEKETRNKSSTEKCWGEF
jgi:hypothetical protein